MGIVNQKLFMARQCQIIQYETISFHLGFKFCLKSNFFHKSCVFKEMLTYFLVLPQDFAVQKKTILSVYN